MSLILKEQLANTVPTPPAGKGTLFLNDSGAMQIRGSDGNLASFPTLSVSDNTQVAFNDAGSFGQETNFTYNKTSNTLTVANLSVTGTLSAGDIAVSSIANGTSNVDIVGVSGNVTISVNSVANVLSVTTAGADVVGTLTANGAVGNGIVGGAKTSGSTRGTGVTGQGYVTASGDTGAAVGVRGFSTDTHSGGYNVGVLGNASGSGLGNYAFYVQAGNIASIETATAWDLVDNSAGALLFNSTGKANILGIETTDGAEGIFTSGYLNVSGNVTATRLISNIAVGTAPLTVTSTTRVANLNVATSGVANTVNDAAQGNITSVGTLTSVSVSGNANIGNIGTGGLITATSNITGGNLVTAGVVSATGNVTGNFFIGNGSQLTGLNTNSISNGNSNVSIATANGNVTITAVGNTTMTVTGTGANITGTLSVTGNVSVGNIIGNGQALTGLTGGNVSGQVGNALVAGTVYTNAQPNITSVGTLTSVSVSGNATVGNIIATNIGNISATNLDGNGSNVLFGNGTFRAFTAFSSNVNGTGFDLGNVGNLGVTGAISVTGNANIGNIGTATAIITTGNITTINSGLLQNGNSNIAITANGNISITAAGGSPELVVTGTGANITGTLSASGNANVANLGVTGVFATTLSASGNANVGNLGTAGLITATGNLNAGNIITGGVVSATGNVTGANLVTAGVLSVTGTGVSSIAGNLDMTSNTIINLASPTNDQDAATKKYVDDVAQGLNIHDSCNAATTGTLASISGGTVTYNNGTSGVGATLTTTGSYTTIDGVTLSNGMRILVKNEVTAANNGIYVRTSSTVLTRATDFNSVPEIEAGDFTFVTAGTLYDNTGWVQTSTVVTVGTDPIDWTQFSGAGTYTAGTGLTLTGSVFSVNVAQPTITSVGTLTSLSVSGNITAGNVSATTFTGALTGNASGSAATVTTAAQPNITSVGTLTSLGVSGTVTASAFTANTGVFTGNGSALTALNASNISTGTLDQSRLANASVTLGSTALTLGSTVTTVAGLTSVTSTTFVGALTGAATTAGTVTTAAQPNITSVGTLTSLGVTGTTTSGNFATAGNITASFLVSNVTTGTAPLTVTSTTRVNNLNVAYANVSDFITVAAGTGNNFLIFANAATGNVSELTSTGLVANLSNNSITATTFVGALSGAATSATSATTAGTVTTNAQPNITSVGTLTGLTLSGTLTGAVQIGTGAATHFGTALTTGANTTAGTVTGNWSLSAGSRWNATYADLSEKYVADANYAPGTVLIFGGDKEVTIANELDTTRVAGVITTDAAYTMNCGLEAEFVADVALQGRVPCKVIGPINKGDLLVSGGNGHAIANNDARAGTIIGKSLQNFTDSIGIIEVAVGRF
jgi:hypothetical protein